VRISAIKIREKQGLLTIRVAQKNVKQYSNNSFKHQQKFAEWLLDII
jgi:hypothetical protein